MNGTRRGFTILELLAVMAIIAILAALGAKGYRLARRQAKESQAKAEIEKLRAALNEYRVEYGGYPRFSGTFSGLVDSLDPVRQGVLTNAVEGIRYTDPWGGDYGYSYSNRFLYSILSAGQDAVAGTEDDIDPSKPGY